MIRALCGCLPGQNSFSRGVGRRQALRATGIGFVATLASILSGAGRTALAQPAAGRVPVVDRLSVRIVTDISTDPYVPALPATRTGSGSSASAGVGSPASHRMPRCGPSGVCPCLQNPRRGDETRRVLVDFGYSPEVLLTNLGILGIDPAAIRCAWY